ncbi:MAG: fibronectin type III domain-containing protein [Treponema sp.]|jgi:hypothetical protein|nr:fibronectin type III domain-containing protein [Treponema sp.]
MTKKRILTTLFYLFLTVSGSLSALDRKTVSIGGSAAWGEAQYRGLTETGNIRPWPVLTLASGDAPASLDLALSFDEGKPELFIDRTGHYRVKSSGGSAISTAGPPWARVGKEAVLFSASTAGLRAGQRALPAPAGPLTIEPYREDALFAPSRNMGDFALEFWVYPLNMENGEQLLSWSAISAPRGFTPPAGAESPASPGLISQRIQCAAAKNRFRWTFEDFFFSPGAGESLDLTLSGQSPLVPKTWSHHLIRFNADTGLLEYLVNGNSEDIVYASSSGREGGQVYSPLAGEGGSFTLGRRFSGMMDEFRIHKTFNVEPELRRYPASGGWVESRAIDLGENSSRILSLEASGGTIGLKDGKVRNEYGEKGDFRFADNSAIQFFLRAADNPYHWTDEDWQTVVPGADLQDTLKGRYAQVAAILYPSGDGEASPYLEEIRLLYQPNQPPRPPSQVMAVSSNGTVTLSWKSSPDQDTAGYLVYYGTVRGEYFGDGATLGASPLDAGKHNSIRIEGLRNGTVYYFAVAAYSLNSPPGASPREPERHVGEFSRELSVRPLRD